MWKDKINTDRWEMKIIVLSLIFAAFTVCFIRTYQRYVVPVVQKTPEEFLINDVQENCERIPLKGGKISQVIQADYNGLSAVGVRFGKNDAKNKNTETSNVVIQIRDTKDFKVLKRKRIPVQQIENQKTEKIELEQELVGVVGDLYQIEIFLEGAGEVYLNVSNEDTYFSGECRQDGTTLKGDISFSLFGSGYQFMKGAYFVIGLLFIFCVMTLLVYIAFWKKIKLENIFLAGTLIFGVVYSIVLPPFLAPDESAHFVLAYNISSDLLGKGQVAWEEQAQQSQYIYDGYFNNYPELDAYKRVYNSLMSSEQNFLSFYDRQYDSIQDNSIVGGHFVQAVAITAGRIMKLGYMQLVYFVRFVNLLFYCSIVYFAIKMMPVGKMFLFGISFLPMVLEEISSVSYDAWVISFAFLYIAYCLHCIYKKDKVTIRDMLLLLLLLFLCSNFKYVYYIMGGLLLLIPKEKFEKRKQQYIFWGILMVLFCVMAGIIVIKSSQPVTAERLALNEKLAGFDRGETYNMSAILRQPGTLFGIYVNTIRDLSGVYLEQMLGQSLGSLNIPVNRIYMYILFLILFIIALHRKKKEQIISHRQGIAFALVCLGVVSATMLAMLVEWTNISNDAVDGVQGRYFLPVLPVFGLLISKLPIQLEKDISKKAICILFTVSYFATLDVFEYCMKVGS